MAALQKKGREVFVCVDMWMWRVMYESARMDIADLAEGVVPMLTSPQVLDRFVVGQDLDVAGATQSHLRVRIRVGETLRMHRVNVFVCMCDSALCLFRHVCRVLVVNVTFSSYSRSMNSISARSASLSCRTMLPSRLNSVFPKSCSGGERFSEYTAGRFAIEYRPTS